MPDGSAPEGGSLQPYIEGPKPKIRVAPLGSPQPVEYMIGSWREGAPRPVIRADVYNDAINWLRTGGCFERGGVFIGDRIHDESTGITRLEATRFVPETGSLGTQINVNVTDAIVNARNIINNESPDLQIVGWIHSHPDMRPAPSGYDNTAMWQLEMSRALNHIADGFFTMIVDPYSNTVGVFRRREDRVSNEGGFAITGTQTEIGNLGAGWQITPYSHFSEAVEVATAVTSSNETGAPQGSSPRIRVRVTDGNNAEQKLVKVKFSFWKRLGYTLRRINDYIRDSLVH